MKHRVVITGLGTVSALGYTIGQNWERLSRGESGLSRTEFRGFEALPHSVCGSIREFDPAALIDNKKLLKLMNRESQCAFIAAGRAMDQAGIRGHFISERMGIFLGTGLATGEPDSLVPIVENSVDADGTFSYRLLGAQALAKCNPLLSFKILPNMALSYISIANKIQGPNLAFNPWPGNTMEAIIEAKRSIESGEIDCALTGGCDSKCNYVSFLTLDRLGLLSHRGRVHVLSPESDGLIPGEGAACMVLESFEHAQGRGARILAVLSGGASLSDCISEGIIPTHSGTLEETMRVALEDAQMDRSAIDVVWSSMNSHPKGDATEFHAIERVFGDSIPSFAALSEVTGDLISAAPAYALAIAVHAFGQESLLPIHTPHSDHHIQTVKEKKKYSAALINAFSAGTVKASLVIERADGE